MKRLLAIAVLALALPTCAMAQVTLAWDPHTEAAQITGFHLYQTKTSGSYGTTPIQTFTPGILTGGTTPKPGLGKWCFVLTAFIAEGTPVTVVESAYSNEVCEVFKPKAPTNFVTKAVVALGRAIGSLFASKKGFKITDIS